MMEVKFSYGRIIVYEKRRCCKQTAQNVIEHALS